MTLRVQYSKILQNRRSLAIGAGAGAVLLWSLVPTLVKWIELNGLSLAFYRMWFGSAVTIFLLYMRGGRLTRERLRSSIPGGLALAADCSIYFVAVKLTTVTNAVVISSLIPLPLLLVAHWMFAERVKLVDLCWVAAALGGVCLVVYGSSRTLAWSFTGDLLAFVAMLLFAGYFIASKRARQSASALECQSGMMLIGAIAMTPLAVIFGIDLSIDSPAMLLAVLVLALLSSSGHMMMNWAHAHMELWVAATLTSSMPAVAALVALAVFGEPIVPWQVAGIVVVVLAVVKVVVRTDQMKTSPNESLG